MASMPNPRSEMSDADMLVYKSKTQIEGLSLLEKLCASGAWVPAWIVKDHLKDMHIMKKVVVLILARKLRFNNACGILQGAGADVFRVDECGNSILHSILSQAAVFNDSNAVIDVVEDEAGIRTCSIPSGGINEEEFILGETKFLISYERGLVIAENNSKELPLHVAAKLGLAKIVNVLIEEGSDINAVTTSNTTPLHLCATHGHLECLKILLDKGADTNIRNIYGAQPIHNAVREGHFECVKLLIKKGADINQPTVSGYTPLHIGVQCSRPAIVELLIQNKVEMNPVMDDGRTPLHITVNCHQSGEATAHLVMLNLLIKAGASLNIRDNEGNTPLHLTIRKANATVAKRLIVAGADISLTDRAGYTPLQVAERKKAETCVEVFKDL